MAGKRLSQLFSASTDDLRSARPKDTRPLNPSPFSPAAYSPRSVSDQPGHFLNPSPYLEPLEQPVLPFADSSSSSPIRGRSLSPAPRKGDGKAPSFRSRSAAAPAEQNQSPGRSASPASRDKRRSSWRSRRSTNGGLPESLATAHPYFTLTPEAQIPYDTTPLASYQKVTELWNEDGDTQVFLFPKGTNRAASFRIDSVVFSSSATLTSLATPIAPLNGPHGRGRVPILESAMGRLMLDGTTAQSAGTTADTVAVQYDTHGTSFASEGTDTASTRSVPSKMSADLNRTYTDSPSRSLKSLYFPIQLPSSAASGDAVTVEDVERLVSIRNLFAFLHRQPLVCTPARPSPYDILMDIAELLAWLNFANMDHSSFGEIPTASSSYYVADLRLADVRRSLEKTIEGVVLGERLKCIELYNEAFTHAVGKLGQLKALQCPKFDMISDVTRQRMELATLELASRVKGMTVALTDFEFPSLFAGIAQSSQGADGKAIHFKTWKSSYLAIRKHIVSLYKDQFGAWPPKPSSKRTEFEEGGLNRLVLQIVYSDFSALYDLLVDRHSLTTRMTGQAGDDHKTYDTPIDPNPRALRRVLSEYDRSTPPVQPPIPFDTPITPDYPSTSEVGMPKLADIKSRQQKLGDSILSKVLESSYNRDADRPTLFLSSFKQFERKQGKGKNLAELRDQRNGYWIFIYAVLQSLPLLVIDSPSIQWSQGVEYFLCATPKGTAPWIKSSHTHRKSWYGVAGSSAVVSLPSEVVDHGIEAIYRRSHAWTAAQQWMYQQDAQEAALAGAPAGYPGGGEELFLPSPGFAERARDGSPHADSRRSSLRNSAVFLGLEQLPVPAGAVVEAQVAQQPQRVAGVHDPSKRFEDILSGVESQKKKKK